MSDLPPSETSTPAAAPPKRAALSWRGRQLPEAAVIALAGLVLVFVVYWLWATPLTTPDSADDRRFDRIEERLAALEPLRERSAQQAEALRQLAPLDQRLRTLEQRPAPADPAQQIAALERRLGALETRPNADAQKLEAVSNRLDRIAERQEALSARIEALNGRIEQFQRELQERVNEFNGSVASVGAAASSGVRTVYQELQPKIAALEASTQRLEAMEGRMARLASLDELRGALESGQPLGPALARLPNPPDALRRFATQAPPTEAALKLSFEDAARAARAAADAAQRGDGSRGGVWDSAVNRLGGLVTVRRGDQVVWGDAAEAELERARRALDAGDLDGALAALAKLPPTAAQAMEGWAGQARALLAARAALRRIVAG